MKTAQELGKIICLVLIFTGATLALGNTETEKIKCEAEHLLPTVKEFTLAWYEAHYEGNGKALEQIAANICNYKIACPPSEEKTFP